MYKDEFIELANQLVKRVDFKDGVVQEILEEEVSKGRILDVRWKGNIHFVLQICHSNWGWYFAERNGNVRYGEPLRSSLRGF